MRCAIPVAPPQDEGGSRINAKFCLQLAVLLGHLHQFGGQLAGPTAQKGVGGTKIINHKAEMNGTLNT